MDCEIGKYLKDYECMKSLVDDVVVKCDEIDNMSGPTSINPNGKVNYWLIIVAPSAINIIRGSVA